MCGLAYRLVYLRFTLSFGNYEKQVSLDLGWVSRCVIEGDLSQFLEVNSDMIEVCEK